MKVAVSIPDPIFSEAEQLAKRLRTSRSELYARALDAYVDRHDPDRITARINEVVDAVGQEDLAFVRAAGRRICERTDW